MFITPCSQFVSVVKRNLENPMCNEPCNWDANRKDKTHSGIQYVMGDLLLWEWISNILEHSINLL